MSHFRMVQQGLQSLHDTTLAADDAGWLLQGLPFGTTVLHSFSSLSFLFDLVTTPTLSFLDSFFVSDTFFLRLQLVHGMRPVPSS
jgi:hypothetical protein